MTIMTKKTRVNYVHIDTPYANGNATPKYSMCIMIPKDDIETIKSIKDAIDIAYNGGIGNKWTKNQNKNTIHNPLRDGDVERPDDANFKGYYFINATSIYKPRVFDQRVTLCENTLVYSGCYARVNLNFYPYSVNGNKGIGAGLRDIQFWEDGERLGPSEKYFDEI